MQSTLLIGEAQGAVATIRSRGSFTSHDVPTTRAAETPVCPRTSISKNWERPNLLFALAPYAIPFAGVGVIVWSLFLGSERLLAYGLITALGGCALGGLAHDDE